MLEINKSEFYKIVLSVDTTSNHLQYIILYIIKTADT